MMVGELPRGTPSTSTTARPPTVLTSIAAPPRVAARRPRGGSASPEAARTDESVPAGGLRSTGAPGDAFRGASDERPAIRSNSLPSDEAAADAISPTDEKPADRASTFPRRRLVWPAVEPPPGEEGAAADELAPAPPVHPTLPSASGEVAPEPDEYGRAVAFPLAGGAPVRPEAPRAGPEDVPEPELNGPDPEGSELVPLPELPAGR
jgi:hypothetical protein